VELRKLITYIDELLNISRYQDYCPNGLQVTGREQINKIISGVSACQDLLDRAIADDADAVLVHHGYFWKDENPCIIGIKKHRLQTLLNNNISLIAYHLPLDFHEVYGNNVQLAKLLGIKLNVILMKYAYGELVAPTSGKDFAVHIEKYLNRKPLYIPGKTKQIKTVAWCSGAGQEHIEAVAQQGIDAYLTGEISEHAVYIARETGIHLFAAGHYATERYGVRALGEHLAKKFNLKHQFIDIDNPI
jgi:dinuclear metal center YbgI/SA1388 family protein